MIRLVKTERFESRIYRGPRLVTPVEYDWLTNRGVTTILNLEKKENDVYFKGNILHFPINEFWPVGVNELKHLAEIIEQSKHIYVHCRRGIDRTGQVVAAWRILYDGWSVESSYQEQLMYGHPELYNLLGWKVQLLRLK